MGRRGRGEGDAFPGVDVAAQARLTHRRFGTMIVSHGSRQAGLPGVVNTTGSQENKVANRSTAKSIDEYIAEFPPETREVLEALRALIKAAAPGATETISYAIPTFDLNGKHLVHFAGYARHVGLYPAPSGLEAFREDLKPYKTGKGSVQFPLDRPLPAPLIRRIVEFRVAQSAGKAAH